MRLIDADKLKKELSKMEDEYKAKICENDQEDPFSDGILSALFTVFQVISRQPTAYDVDKVVEQLEEYKKQWIDSDYLAGIDEIIDIVRAGGVE